MPKKSIKCVLLFPTYRCNLHCSFCLSFNGYWKIEPNFHLPPSINPKLSLNGKTNTFMEMSTEDITKRVIPQCESNGVEALALSGGEVLMRKDAEIIFRALGSSRMEWGFDSNMICVHCYYC